MSIFPGIMCYVAMSTKHALYSISFLGVFFTLCESSNTRWALTVREMTLTALWMQSEIKGKDMQVGGGQLRANQSWWGSTLLVKWIIFHFQKFGAGPKLDHSSDQHLLSTILQNHCLFFPCFFLHLPLTPPATWAGLPVIYAGDYLTIDTNNVRVFIWLCANVLTDCL